MVGALGTSTSTLAAQEPGAEARRVRGVVSGSMGATRLAGQTGGLWGVGAGVWVGPVYVGGRGAAVPGTIVLEQSANPDSRLQFGYAGLNLGLRSWQRGDLQAVVDVLAGAGRAQVEDAFVRRELGADNFLTLEPALRLHRGLAGGALQAGVSLGYRQVWGVEDLPGLNAADLRGPTVTFSLSLERR